MNYNMNKTKSIREILNKKEAHFLTGCILGAFIFLLIYGLDVINVTNVSWLTHSKDAEGLWDLTQHYLGWEFYRQSPWHFPLGLADGLYSDPVSIVYTDSIPLFAFIFKILSPILPETFQYFGLFGLMTYMLMGGFGALIIGKYNSNPLYSSISAIIMTISPVLTKRMFYHTALSAHFLILMAIALWIYRDDLFISQEARNKSRLKTSYILLWSALISASALINAYYTPMVLGILLLSCLQDLISSGWYKTSILRSLTCLVPSLLFTTVIAYAFGFFYGDVAPSTVGLNNLSFNMNQLINPTNYLCNISNYTYSFTKQSYSAFLPDLAVASGWQEEGFAYLGLGMILAFIIMVILIIIYHLQPETSSLTALVSEGYSWVVSVMVGLIIFTFLALSPVATAGNHIIYSINYPHAVYKILSIFRSCGRFIWPVYYGILVVTLATYAKIADRFRLLRVNRKNTFAKNILPALLICICILQIVDLYPSLKYKHDCYHQDFSEYESPLNDPAWDELGAKADKIMFYTPSIYGIECNPELSCLFEEFALEYNLSLNVTYMSRDMSSFADKKTMKHFMDRENGLTDASIIYIFYDISDIPPAAQSHLNYYLLNGYVVGSDLYLENASRYNP